MKLSKMVPNPRYCTDKDTTHSYLEVYDDVFAPYQDKDINLLEIGNNGGGSIKLWLDYFKSIKIHGLEINNLKELHDLNNQYDNIDIVMGLDAYCEKTLELTRSKGPFDIIIDDGSHLPVHQLFAINYYMPLLKSGGLMVIEDIQSVDLISLLLNNIISLKSNDKVEVFDRRNIKDRFDDIMIVIKKG